MFEPQDTIQMYAEGMGMGSIGVESILFYFKIYSSRSYSKILLEVFLVFLKNLVITRNLKTMMEQK